MTQPVLFIGLGGTGCRVGRELERTMRGSLCGPDGTDLMARLGRGFLPYQLPSFLQFVYSDLSMNELGKVLQYSVPGPDHHAAAQQTMQLIANLVPPNMHGSAQLTQAMRIGMPADMIDWLPGAETDPRVAPLTAGAGQLPTVARAVLFETMRQGSGPDTVLHGVIAALRKIAAAGPELVTLGGRLDNTLDVFVAFSVAGGTGCGIFLDYLYMVGDLIRRTGTQARIYPLVLMPSAFENGMGGGRPAQLNAGAALVDLFRLIDDQNAQGTADMIGGAGASGPLSVRLPGEPAPISLLPATVQTAFLFGRPDDGVSGEDIIRSMVSLMLALTGAGPEGGVSFAEHFVNATATRSALADTGIGRRGVSTAAVASLSIPLPTLADLVSSRLLADAVREMRQTPTASGVQNRDLLRQFDIHSGLEEFIGCQPLDGFDDVTAPPSGYDAIVQALRERTRSMRDGLDRNERQLGPHVSQLARDFTPVKAAEHLSRTLDPFQLRRVVRGAPEYTEPLDRFGFDRVLTGRREGGRASANLKADPPQPDSVRKPRLLGKLYWADASVQENLNEQDEWWQQRVRELWYRAWGKNANVWEPRWRAFCDQLVAITDAFVDHVAVDDREFNERRDRLSAARLGVSYLLPPGDDGVRNLYERVVKTLTTRHQERLGPNPGKADLVSLILGDDGWLAAYRAGREKPEAAVASVRQRIRGAVSECLRPGGGERALVPAMRDLLAAKVGRPAAAIEDADLRDFEPKVAGMVPRGYAPAGDGELSVLISYAGAARDHDVETFLRRSILLPDDTETVDFRTNDSDSLVVVLFRTNMGITEVPEVREAIHLRSQALRHEQPGDRLQWRQRLGAVSSYPACTAIDRSLVLQGFLNALWNGWVELDANDRPDCPQRILAHGANSTAARLVLDLTPFRELSSWASLLQAYEEFILADGDRNRRDLAAELMKVLPVGLDRDPKPPSPLFTTLLHMQEKQMQLVEEVRARPGLGSSEQLDLIHEFWSQTLPAALDLPFRGVQAPFANLRGMVEFFEHEAAGR